MIIDDEIRDEITNYHIFIANRYSAGDFYS